MIDLKEVDFRVGFVKSREALTESSIDFSDAIGAFELVRVSYRSADQDNPDFQTYDLKECDLGDSDERKKYDSMLKSSDKIYCPPEDIEEMDAHGSIQTDIFTFWMIQFRPCITYDEYLRQFSDDDK